MPDQDHQPNWNVSRYTPRYNPWLIALVVNMATFMEVLDTSIANVSLPHIAGSLGASSDEATWILTSYLVASGVVLPISGWLATRFGRKRYYMSCVAIFTCCSFLCGIAPNLPALIFFRILQGIGGGGLATSEQSILADTFPVSKRGQAFAVYGMAVVVAPAIGPTLGGWITDNFNWHWIFFINIPVGIISLFLTHKMVDDPPYLLEEKKKSMRERVDFLGLGLVALGVGCLEFVLDKGQEKDWFGDPTITAFAIVAAVALVVFVIWEWRHPDPIVDLRLLQNRNFGTAVFLQFILGMVLFGSTILIPQMLQALFGYTAERAGMVLSPAGFLMMLLMPVSGKLVGKVKDARILVAIGYALTAVGLLNLTRLNLDVSYGTITFWRMLQVCGLPFIFIPISTLNYVGVPQNKNNQISSFSNFARNIGGSVGTAMLTTFLIRAQQVHQSNMASNITSGSARYQSYVSQITATMVQQGQSAAQAARTAVGYAYLQMGRQAGMLSYKNAFAVLGTIVLVLVPLPFIMRKPPRNAGAPPPAH
jgi:MFS transporter, DHA2 family, multidrug resistance protein